MTVIAITGQRPQSLDNDYTYKSEMWQWIYKELGESFDKIKPERVYSGMALGVDTVAAEVAIRRDIPLTAAIPFRGQENPWSDEQQERYNLILALADEVVYVNETYEHPGVYQQRNEYMVDNADLVVAVWTGFKGGTRNCVEYALNQQIPVWRLDPKTRKVGRYDGTTHIVKVLV